MAKRGKIYKANAAKVNRDKKYTLDEALSVIDSFQGRKFDETIELAVNLGVDRSGNVLVLSSAGPVGTVYAFRPDGPRGALTVVQPQPWPAAGTASVLTVSIPGPDQLLPLTGSAESWYLPWTR